MPPEAMRATRSGRARRISPSAAPQAWQRAGVGWGGRYTLTCSGTMGRAGSGITKCSGT